MFEKMSVAHQRPCRQSAGGNAAEWRMNQEDGASLMTAWSIGLGYAADSSLGFEAWVSADLPADRRFAEFPPEALGLLDWLKIDS